MYSILTNLINKKYYKEKSEIEQKMSVFFAFNVLTEEEYTNLMQLVSTIYVDTVNDSTESETKV